MSTLNTSFTTLDSRYSKPADVTSAIAAQTTANSALFVPQWKANTAYTSGQYVLNPTGILVQAGSSFTSGATYNATNWNILSVSANASGTANNPITSASAARPTGLTKVFWQCATQPTNWIAGDEWINTA